MARNASQFARRAAIVALKDAAPVVALVPAERVYPLQWPPNPTWPFIGFGAPVTVPFAASCLDGSETDVLVHGFAETTGEGDDTVGGEDMAAEINAAIEGALTDATLDLQAHGAPWPATAHFTWVSSQVVRDGLENDKFHGFVRFRITVSS